MLPLYTGEVKVEGADLNFQVEDNPRASSTRWPRGRPSTSASSRRRNTSRGSRRASAHSSRCRCSPRGCFATASSSSTEAHQDAEGPRGQADRRAALHHDGGDLHRGLLSDEFGIDFSNAEWVEGDINSAKPHGSPTILPTVRQVSIFRQRLRKVAEQAAGGRRDPGLIGIGEPDAFGRIPISCGIYPDYREAEKEYYKRTRIFPIMHLVVIRRDMYEKHPFDRDGPLQSLRQAKTWSSKR